MNRIWIGDSRGVGIKQSKVVTDEDIFIVKSGMAYSWFKSTALSDLSKALSTAPSSAVIIMMGVNDCANYCCSGSNANFSSATNCTNYAEIVNKLITQYPSTRFYFCSVNPVDGNYSTKYHSRGYIPKDDFNNAIINFNDAIREKCTATYIDCHAYLNSSGFKTSDGIHYTGQTTKSIYNYIVSFINNGNYYSSGGYGGYSPRTTAPTENDIFWLSSKYTTEGGEEGKNPYAPVSDDKDVKDEDKSENGEGGFTLPNSAAYAWGRFYELLQLTPALCAGDAEDWFEYNDGYARSTDEKTEDKEDAEKEKNNGPRLGAIMCWKAGTDDSSVDGTGHVAVVEQVIDDENVVVSESLDPTEGSLGVVFQNRELSNKDGNWGLATNEYTFQGFIYCPAIQSVGGYGGVFNDVIDKSQLPYRPGQYLNESEKQLYARYICKVLMGYGWTLNAVAGLLGNLDKESTLNPDLQEKNNSRSGYGLAQWTPGSKLVNWCKKNGLAKTDIDSQLLRIEHERGNFGVCCSNCRCGQYSFATRDGHGCLYPTTYPPKTFNEFAVSTMAPYDLASAFLYNYERPGSIIYSDSESTRAAKRKERGDCANKWYEYLAGYCSGVSGVSVIKSFNVSNFLVNTIKATSVDASFIVSLGSTGTYILSRNDKQEQKESLGDLTDKDFMAFTVDNLVPNTEYALSIEVENEQGEAITPEAITFKTLQDYPKPVGKIDLTFDNLQLPNNPFKVQVEKPSDWGYWKNVANNKYGYELQVLVNGSCKKVVLVDEFTDKTFTAKDFEKTFGEIDVKIGDSLQLGIRTWVLDNSNVTLYDSDFAVTSNSICLLEQPITCYLNNK